jgi:hypothetical protein
MIFAKSKYLNKEKIKMRKINTRVIILLIIFVVGSSDLLAQTRIRFARGTSSTVAGKMVYGERSFVLGARYGQYLSANVSSRNGCVRFSNGGTSTSYITRSGNKYLYLINSCRQRNFTLTVSIQYGSD